MRADYAELGLGEYAPAFVSYHWEDPAVTRNPLTTLIYWDCVGDPMLLSEVHRSSSVFAKWCGVGWAYPDYWCATLIGHRYADGMFEDMRSLKMLVAGCCPMELNADMMGTEGTPD